MSLLTLTAGLGLWMLVATATGLLVGRTLRECEQAGDRTLAQVSRKPLLKRTA